MNSIFTNYQKSGNLHHAYLCVGAGAVILPQIKKLAAEVFGQPMASNPDFLFTNHLSFGIDDSRLLRARQACRPFGRKQFFVCQLETITTEAQNALLKTFEEPTPGTHFFIIAPTAEIFLPTLRSRCEILFVATPAVDGEIDPLIKKFLAAGPAARLVIVSQLVDKAKINNFLNQLEIILSEQNVKQPMSNLSGVFKDIWQAKNYLRDQASSPRLLLEHLATTIN